MSHSYTGLPSLEGSSEEERANAIQQRRINLYSWTVALLGAMGVVVVLVSIGLSAYWGESGTSSRRRGADAYERTGRSILASKKWLIALNVLAGLMALFGGVTSELFRRDIRSMAYPGQLQIDIWRIIICNVVSAGLLFYIWHKNSSDPLPDVFKQGCSTGCDRKFAFYQNSSVYVASSLLIFTFAQLPFALLLLVNPFINPPPDPTPTPVVPPPTAISWMKPSKSKTKEVKDTYYVSDETDEEVVVKKERPKAKGKDRTTSPESVPMVQVKRSRK